MRPPHQPNHLSISGQRAFSLIEVTLALGVVSFALVSLMGLLPIGLISVREAMSQTACTHIVQRMAADMEMMTPGDLSDYVNEPKYFDYNGGYLENGSQSAATFVANLSTNDLEYPGSSRLSSLGSNFTRVVVTISRYTQTGDTPKDHFYRASLLVTDAK